MIRQLTTECTLFSRRTLCLVAFVFYGCMANAQTLERAWLDSAPPEALGEQIAKNVETRFSKSEANKKFTDHTDTYLADSSKARVRIHMSAGALEEILESGQILNQHETGYSGGGGFDPDLRIKIEEDLAGFKFSKDLKKDPRLAKILPKYGIVEFHDFATDPAVRDAWELKTGRDTLAGYGDVVVYLDDTIKARTTVFPSDTGDGLHGKTRDLGQSLTQKQIRIIFHQADKGEFFEAEVWGPISVEQIASVVIDAFDLKANPRLRKLLRDHNLTVDASVAYGEKTPEHSALEEFRVVPRGKALMRPRVRPATASKCEQVFN